MTSLVLILQLSGLFFIVWIDPYLSRQHRRVMLLVIALAFSLIAQNFIEYQMELHRMILLRRLVGIYGYCVRPLILVLFLYIVNPSHKYRIPWTLLGINTAIHLTAIFSDICFWVGEENHFHRGPLGYSCHITSGILLVYLFFLAIKKYRHTGASGIFIPAFNTVLIVAAVLADSITDYRNYPKVTYLTIAIVSGSLFFYIWLHLQFVEEHEKDLEAQQRIRIMVSQIQPHFLYNTLMTIQALCRIDPELAFDTVEMFGMYLRQNIDFLDQAELIPLEKEMEHTKIYADIEQIRFPNIHVEYEILEKDFFLPALTVQPLVENAIRHGVRAKKDGRVRVCAQETDGFYELRIEDNGKGFDAIKFDKIKSREMVSGEKDSTETGKQEKHIGIQNVRERIQKLCHGTLAVKSHPGEGTTVTMRIPMKGAGLV